MKVLTCSRHFPKGHPRFGAPTFFVEQILNSILPRAENGIINRNDINPEVLPFINDFVLLDGTTYKHTTIRAGSRWKAGDMASLRIWSDMPYRSKQIEFAQVEIIRTWEFILHFVGDDLYWKIPGSGGGEFDCLSEALKIIAKNDGLEIRDFIDWFVIHPKTKGRAFTGQIITWSPSIAYQ
jgi:hypothetical protein